MIIAGSPVLAVAVAAAAAAVQRRTGAQPPVLAAHAMHTAAAVQRPAGAQPPLLTAQCAVHTQCTVTAQSPALAVAAAAAVPWTTGACWGSGAHCGCSSPSSHHLQGLLHIIKQEISECRLPEGRPLMRKGVAQTLGTPRFRAYGLVSTRFAGLQEVTHA
eukprot:1159185-Pelagomonas_calceolata.AAC.10